MKKLLLPLVFLSYLSSVNAQPMYSPQIINEKVDSVLGKMTLDEKIGQLNQCTSQWEMTGPAPKDKSAQDELTMIKEGKVGSMLNVTGAEASRRAQQLAVENSRLGIPLLFGYDVIHGYRTMFPIPLATAASWDPEAAKTSARVAAREASAAGVHWTFAPMVDISRDARWGRVMEGAGEDPYLGAIMAAAQVHGFQGDNLYSLQTIAACAKHFAAYGFVEGGREYNSVDISENTLRNFVLPPFKACADAGVATFMNAFNTIGGVPSTANKHLLRDILKGEWNYQGFVVSDWNSIGELVDHGVAPTKRDAARLAIEAGSDMDMEGNCYINNLKNLVVTGQVDESLIDDAVRRILRVKFELGLFDDPYRYCDAKREKAELLSKKNLEASREVARESIVLLKNEKQLLPLKKSGQKIAVIGDLADDKDSPLGSWRAQAIKGSAVSLLEGLREAVADKSTVKFAQGPVYVKNDPEFTKELQINDSDTTGMAQAVELARKSDVVVMALGENCFQTGEGRSQTTIGLKGLQLSLLKAVYNVNPNVVVVLMNGRPLAVTWTAEHVPSVVEAWELGSEAGNAIADVLFGDYNPSGKLPISFPRAVGQVPVYYNHLSTGRSQKTPTVFWSHYTDQSNDALYPFGYGLSYTHFTYSDLQLSRKMITKDQPLTVSVTIRNDGTYVGIETAQLYIHDCFASVARPVKELKGYQRISLKPGEHKTIHFQLTAADLAFYNAQNKKVAEPGKFEIWVGTNSAEGLKDSFILQ